MDTELFNLENLNCIVLDCEIEAYVPSVGLFKTVSKFVTKSRKFVLDTGAMFTGLAAYDIGIIICEEEFVKYTSLDPIIITGIDKTSSIRFYKIQVEDFKIGEISLGSVPIFITFDSNYNCPLLGMDLLRLLNINLNCDTKQLLLKLTDNFLRYKRTHLRIGDSFALAMGTDEELTEGINSFS